MGRLWDRFTREGSRVALIALAVVCAGALVFGLAALASGGDAEREGFPRVETVDVKADEPKKPAVDAGQVQAQQEVAGVSASSWPSCELPTEPAPPAEAHGPFEPNDSRLTAKFALGAAAPLSAALEGAHDEDWFALCTSDSAERATVTATNMGNPSDVPCTLEVLIVDEKGEQVGEAALSASADEPAEAAARVKPNRLYFAQVRDFDGLCEDTYAPYPYDIAAGPAAAFAK